MILDQIELERLKTISSPTKEDMDSIFLLYRKYIRNVTSYKTDCECSNVCST